MFGDKPTRVDYANIPHAVFSHPPIASVGMTEGEARDKLGTYKTYVSDFRPMKNVLAGRNERSLYKLVVDEETDKVVGIHMIGPDAPEILQAAADGGQGGADQGAVRRDGGAPPDHVGRAGVDAVNEKRPRRRDAGEAHFSCERSLRSA